MFGSQRRYWYMPTIRGIGVSIPCAACVYLLTGNWLATGLVFVASLAGIGWNTLVLLRQHAVAEALLSTPDSLVANPQSANVFVDLAAPVVLQLEEQAAEIEAANRLRTEQDARHHMRLKESRRTRHAIEAVQQPVMIFDGRGDLKFANRACQELLATLTDETESANASDPVAWQRLPNVATLIRETTERSIAKNSRKSEFELIQNGKRVHFRATATILTDGEDRMDGVAVVLENTSGEQDQKARHAEFVSSVCHELKTPMAGVKAYAELLMDGDVSDVEETREVCQYIDAQVERLTRLINNMLNLSRIESGVIQVKREDCELNTVLKQALDVVTPTADEKSIKIVGELSGLYIPAHLDTDLMGQAVINLLSNAVKYTPENGEVRLRSRMEEGHTVIEVRDTGMGIPEDSLPRIFDRFYRVPENEGAAAGTGLGLALVHYIVTELHGGSVAVQSKVGEGTVFSLTLPVGHQSQSRNDDRKTACRTLAATT